NCRALLVQGGLPYCLTKVHTGKNMKERRRVLAAGGTFSSSDRDSLVCGVLPVTRGLGNHGDKRLKDCVIVDPYVTSVPIYQHSQFLILASGGLWEVLSDEEVTCLLLQMLPDQQIPPPREISQLLWPLLHGQQEPESGDVTIGPQFPGQHDARNTPATRDQIFAEQHDARNTPATSDQIFAEQHDARNTPTTSDQIFAEQHDARNTPATSDQIFAEQSHQSYMGIASYVKSEPNLVLQKDQMQLQMPNSTGDPHLNFRNLNSCENAEPSEEPNMTSASPDITDSVHATRADKRKELSRAMAEHLTQAAILAGAKNNLTVMVVLLPGCGI
ncbi:unnamed protein product, partial [Candidula unifasciata]